MAISPARIDEFRRLLQETAAEIRLGLAADDPTRDSIRPDNAIGRLTRMEAIQAQSMDTEGRRRAQKRLNMIERALERIDAGKFGQCIDCGDEISTGRLEVMPEAPFCMNCVQRRRE